MPLYTKSNGQQVEIADMAVPGVTFREDRKAVVR